MQKDFLSITDLSKNELIELLDIAATQKRQVTSEILRRKETALIFEKQSLRTKASFETGIREMGGGVSYFGPSESGRLGERESIEDQAKTLSRYYDAIVARVYDHVSLEKLAAAATIPVINALSDREHPCQILADLFTIRERLGRVEKFKLTYVGDGNNVALSLALASEVLGFEFILVGPTKYHLPYEQIKQTEDLDAALKNADIVYTDTWVSMGNEIEAAEREKIFQPYQVNAELLKKAKKDALVMHCLPAHREKEITSEVMNGLQSIVFDQAANRLPAQKALLIKVFLRQNMGYSGLI
jgi:ornithine carbamoyltransferase